MKSPARIVCLTAESTELLFALGAGPRVVGVSSFAEHPPVARDIAKVSAYTTVRYDRIDELRPNLVLAFSDLQAEAAAELARRGHNVLLTNQRTLADIFETTLLLGRLVDEQENAQRLIAKWKADLQAAGSLASENPPRVYFEEWNDPPICGIGWISELITAAGGIDIFANLAAQPSANERIVHFDMIQTAKPDVILGSWCGKPFQPQEVMSRTGWGDIPAVANRRVHAIDPADCLQPGIGLFERGLPIFFKLLAGEMES